MNHFDQSNRHFQGRGQKRSSFVAKTGRDSAADRVLALVSAHDAVAPALLLHPSRCRAPVARSRQLAMYLMHTLLGRSMTEVGAYFGRDRTTVAHACGLIEDCRDDRDFDEELTALEQKLSPGVHATFGAAREPDRVGY